MDDRPLFAAAFEAQGDAPDAPPGFVDRVMDAAPRPAARPSVPLAPTGAV